MRKKDYIYFVLIQVILFNAFNIANIEASNYVKIAVINEIPRINKGHEPQELVKQVIEYWEGQLPKVLSSHPDLIVLTEACDRPSWLSREEQYAYFSVRKNQVLDFFASVAKDNNCYIAFGMKRKAEDGSWFNSSYVLDRNGLVAGVYNKNFPTIGELESGIKASDETPIIQCDFGRVACAICYDLNFPELRMKYEELKPDIILFSSMYHGGLVQNYWAYSCRSFFVGAIGDKFAPSEIRNPLGEVVASTSGFLDFVITTINLDRRLVHFDFNSEKLINLKKKYGDAVTITNPGKLEAIMVESEDPNINVGQMLKEFDIELLDDYFDRSRRIRNKPGNIGLP